MPTADGSPQPGDPNYVTPSQPGLVDSSGPAPTSPSTGVTGYTPAQATATTPTSQGYAPTSYVTPASADVSTAVQKIVAPDSVLMQQARQNAVAGANAKGLVNSSIAQGAAEQAVIAQALPMAQQNAQQDYSSMSKTADSKNAEAAFEAQAANTAQSLGAQLKTSTDVSNAASINTALQTLATAKNTADLNTSLAQLQSETQKYIQQLSSSTQIQTTQMTTQTQQQIAQLQSQTNITTANISADVQRQLGTLNANNQQLLQTNVNAATMFNQVANNIAQIQQDANLDAGAKANAIQSQINLLNEGLQQAQSAAGTPQSELQSLNLGQFFANGTGFGGSGSGGTNQSGGSTAPAAAGTAPTTNPGGASPQPGQDFWNSTWSDGIVHQPPAPGTTYQVPGYGWAGSDGKLYTTQAQAMAAGQGNAMYAGSAPTAAFQQTNANLASAGYSVNASGQLLDPSGNVVGRVDAQGNVTYG